MAAPITPGTVGGPERRGTVAWGCQRDPECARQRAASLPGHLRGGELVYYPYPEGFPGDLAAWSLTSQQMPAWTGATDLSERGRVCHWILDRSLRKQAHIGGGEASATRDQR